MNVMIKYKYVGCYGMSCFDELMGMSKRFAEKSKELEELKKLKDLQKYIKKIKRIFFR